MEYDAQILNRIHESLKQAYEDYTLNVSTPGAAISLNTSTLCVAMLDQFKPAYIIDTGSGWSSYVFRSWANKQMFDVKVVSIDDNGDWLQKSVDFCKRYNLPTDDFLLWDNETSKNLLEGDKCGLILHDMGNRRLRMKTLDWVASIVSDDGIIVFDDMHKGDLRKSVEGILGKNHLILQSNLTDLTKDDLTRYSWITQRVLDTTTLRIQ